MAQPRLLTRPATRFAGHNCFNSPPAVRRTFFQNASAPLTLHATRTLPYRASDLYKLISDISEYPNYIPYCSSASVQTWSAVDANGKKWPATATLSIGYSGFSENFLSRVYCVPDTLVEAVSGNASTSIPPSDLAHYVDASQETDATSNELFKSLRTRWSLKAYEYKPAEKHPEVAAGTKNPGEVSVEGHGGEGGIASVPRTDVGLVIEVDWKNPIYAAASQALAPSVAGKIVEAFERRAREVLGKHEQ